MSGLPPPTVHSAVIWMFVRRATAFIGAHGGCGQTLTREMWSMIRA